MSDAKKPTVNLRHVDGNAMCIIGACRRAGRRAGWTEAQLDAFSAEATSGDYDHVLQTAMKFFDVEYE